jgi:hypothetical protein
LASTTDKKRIIPSPASDECTSKSCRERICSVLKFG